MTGCEHPRILIATVLPTTGETGVQAHLNYFREYLAETGTDSEVLTPYDAPRLFRRVLNVTRRTAERVNAEFGALISREVPFILLRHRMRSRLPHDEPWIVYAQCPGSALAALRFRRRADQRVVLMVHFYLSTADEAVECGRIRDQGPCYRRILRQEEEAFEQVDAVVFCSHFMRRTMLSRMPSLHAKPTIVLPNFAAMPAHDADVPTGDILSIGLLAPLKNHGYLFRVLAEANRMGHRYTLTLAGEGRSRPTLQALALDLGVASQVTFAGFIPRASRLLWRHRVYAHAAVIENLPIAIIEALAAARPVLAPRVGGIPELIKDEVEGFLWPLDNPSLCARQLIQVLEDSELYGAMQTAARRAYTARFSPQVVGPRLLNFLLDSAQGGASA